MTGREAENRADPPARILIVDDEPLNVDYLEQELESLGFATVTAADGSEALERVAANPPDLVLLDVMMPRMDGISVLRVLKDDPETRLIPVVLMTALNAVEDRVRGIEAGADDFLSKPVDDRELLARIRTALSHKRAIDETVDELRITSAHLYRYGRQERDVAVLAVDFRLREASLPDDAVTFVGRRHREAAEERIRALGGLTSESDPDLLVAVFGGPDPAARSSEAVTAALAVVGDRPPEADAGASASVAMSAAVSVGSAQVGSTRVQHAGEPRWVYGAGGEPVERASKLAREAGVGEVVVSGDAAAVVSDRFRLETAGEGGYRVLAPATVEDTAGARGPPRERRIRTILITDIVESTKTAERVGDRAWSELLSSHNQTVRAEIVPFGGEEIDTIGDGFLVLFDSPERAIRCALAVIDRLSELGLTIRAGIHTGEVERAGDGVRGIAVNMTSRIAARANSAEVLVSATTRELSAGSGLAFTDRGEHTLSGVSEQKRLFAALEEEAHRSAQLERRSGRSQSSDDSSVIYPEGLTAREVDVLRLVAAGLTDAEAAEQLFVSVRTVNAHLRSIYRKLGVSSRAAAGRFAAENDLL
jgi:DNA-binding NarL/FixJ family response regulator